MVMDMFQGPVMDPPQTELTKGGKLLDVGSGPGFWLKAGCSLCSQGIAHVSLQLTDELI